MPFIITGMSGAGKSTALHTLEDMGCFCTDNLPLELLDSWAELIPSDDKTMAVCVDARSAHVEKISTAFQTLIDGSNPWHLIFLEANDQALLRRFSTLRRRHPFAPETDLAHAIVSERAALCSLRGQAELVIDTSGLNPYQLADRIEAFWQRKQHTHGTNITVSLLSFSYRKGLPPDADMVIDVRFLPNPHYEAALASLTGRDEAVQHFLAQQPEALEAEQLLQHWLSFIGEKLKRERKQYFTLAIGCSGGQHRSVYMVERLAAWMQQKQMATPLIRHRELNFK